MRAVGLSIDGICKPLRSLVDANWAVPDDVSGWVALLDTKGPIIGVGFAGVAPHPLAALWTQALPAETHLRSHPHLGDDIPF
jgi:hypothetical protein